MTAEPSPAAPKPPWWKNIFVLSFIVGIVMLSALPILQRRFLKAPPPIRSLPAWEFQTLKGEPVGSKQLAGKVWLFSLVPGPCDPQCLERQQAFGRALQHVDDLHGRVELVTFVLPEGKDSLGPLAQGAAPSWHFAVGSMDELRPLIDAFRNGWELFAQTDAGATAEAFASLPGYGLVDEENALRGFWRDDVAGRGNAINAARLLAQYGPRP